MHVAPEINGLVPIATNITLSEYLQNTDPQQCMGAADPSSMTQDQSTRKCTARETTLIPIRVSATCLESLQFEVSMSDNMPAIPGQAMDILIRRQEDAETEHCMTWESIALRLDLLPLHI